MDCAYLFGYVLQTPPFVVEVEKERGKRKYINLKILSAMQRCYSASITYELFFFSERPVITVNSSRYTPFVQCLKLQIKCE